MEILEIRVDLFGDLDIGNLNTQKGLPKKEDLAKITQPPRLRRANGFNVIINMAYSKIIMLRGVYLKELLPAAIQEIKYLLILMPPFINIFA